MLQGISPLTPTRYQHPIWRAAIAGSHISDTHHELLCISIVCSNLNRNPIPPLIQKLSLRKKPLSLSQR